MEIKHEFNEFDNPKELRFSLKFPIHQASKLVRVAGLRNMALPDLIREAFMEHYEREAERLELKERKFTQ